MTNEELNTALYEKMFSEQETYRAWLLAQSPEEILNHTYESSSASSKIEPFPSHSTGYRTYGSYKLCADRS